MLLKSSTSSVLLFFIIHTQKGRKSPVSMIPTLSVPQTPSIFVLKPHFCCIFGSFLWVHHLIKWSHAEVVNSQIVLPSISNKLYFYTPFAITINITSARCSWGQKESISTLKSVYILSPQLRGTQRDIPHAVLIETPEWHWDPSLFPVGRPTPSASLVIVILGSPGPCQLQQS